MLQRFRAASGAPGDLQFASNAVDLRLVRAGGDIVHARRFLDAAMYSPPEAWGEWRVLFWGLPGAALVASCALSSATWHPGPAGPSARSALGLSLDPVLQQLVLFGGRNLTTGEYFAETWTLG